MILFTINKTKHIIFVNDSRRCDRCDKLTQNELALVKGYISKKSKRYFCKHCAIITQRATPKDFEGILVNVN